MTCIRYWLSYAQQYCSILYLYILTLFDCYLLLMNREFTYGDIMDLHSKHDIVANIKSVSRLLVIVSMRGTMR